MRAILQSESAECGLACLAMVASAYGKQVGLTELRQEFPLSLKGVKLPQLLRIAEGLELQARPLRLNLDQLSKLSTPCILHWDMSHFVVLKSVGRKNVVVLDPAVGERRLSFDQISESFTGIAVELIPTASFRPKDKPRGVSIRQLTGPITGLRSGLIQLVGISLALQLFVLVSPLYLQWIVDQVLVSMDQDLLIVLGIGFGLAILLQTGITLLRGWIVIYLSSRLGLHWMGNVFGHLMRLPLEFFEKRNLGDITSRLSSIQVIQRTLSTSFIETFIDGLMAVVTLALMLVYSAKLAMITLGAVGLYMAIRYLAYTRFRDAVECQLVASGRQHTHLLESLRGIQSLKVAGGESQRRSIFGNLMVDTVNEEVRIARMDLGFSSVQQLIFGVERIAVIWVGAVLTLQNVFSVGMLVAYLAYKELFSSRMGTLVDKWVALRMLRLHGERLGDIVLSPPEDVVNSAALPLTDDTSIHVEGLSFRYGEDESWVLKDCSFSVQSGQSAAIVGGSGCGKTTLIKLLLGLLQPSAGTIRIGGRDLHAAGPRNIRASIGVVMQDDQLFAGTIAENIAFFDAPPDQERIERAARMAAIYNDIVAMPMGFYSLIGDMGSALSGGQKQRVIVARALYRNPRILFLDEATSHLDVDKEQVVNEAIRDLQLTKVIVAHRPNTIASAEVVLELRDGEISTRR